MGVKIGRPQKLMCHMMSDPYHVMGKVALAQSLVSWLDSMILNNKLLFFNDGFLLYLVGFHQAFKLNRVRLYLKFL